MVVLEGHDINKARIEIIDVMKGDPESKEIELKRIQRETTWIINLKTLNPLGINGRLGRPISS
jgi:hypothetical protein